MNFKKVILLFIAVISAVTWVRFPVNATDVGNNTSTGEVNIPGRAEPGNAAWSDRQESTMWKLSVYVAKNEKATFAEEDISVTNSGNVLSALSLSEDFYKFGETFWLYEGVLENGAVHSIYEKKKNDYAKRFWFATSSKEEYLSDYRGLSTPGGSLGFIMSSSDTISNRLFDVRDYNRMEGVSVNGYAPKDGKNIILPYVKNVNGNTAYNSPLKYDEAVEFFFCLSKRNWNCFLDFAALAAGYTNYSQLLYTMLEEEMFTYEGTVITSYNDVDPGRKQSSIIPGRWENETSQVAWVLMFEPVIVFYKYLSDGYNYYAMTASDAAAAMISGSIAFTITTGTNGYTMVSGVKNARNAAPEIKRKELSSWAFISPFFINLSSSVIPRYPWFGYESPVSGDWYSVKSNLIYYDKALEKGGVGFRYQAGGKVAPETRPESTLVIEKIISDRELDPDFTGIRFAVSGNVNGKSVSLDIDCSKANSLVTGTATHPGTIYAENIDSEGYKINVKYEKVSDENGKISARFTVSLPSVPSRKVLWRIMEIAKPEGYGCVRFTNAFGKIVYNDLCYVEMVQGNTYNVYCENMKTSPLTITKIVKNEKGTTVDDYSDIVFLIEGVGAKNKKFGTVAVDTYGRLLNPSYEYVNGNIEYVVRTVFDPDGDLLRIIDSVFAVTARAEKGPDGITVTVQGIPDGDWKISEYYKSINGVLRYYKTYSGYGETAGRGGDTSLSERSFVTVSKSANSNEYGTGSDNYVYFENYVTGSLFDVELRNVMPNAPYTAGTYVVTSYRLINNSLEDVFKNTGLTAYFYVFCYINGEQVTVFETSKNEITVPANEENLVWFKWRVPEYTAGMTLHCCASVNPEGTIPETNYDNNGAMIINDSVQRGCSETPDTSYERDRPQDFVYSGIHYVEDFQVARWTVWEQEDDHFVRKSYAFSIADYSLINLIPDSDAPNDNSDGVRSGHGFLFETSQYVIPFLSSGGTRPDEGSFTGVQSCRLLLPEYNYSTEENCCLDLDPVREYTSGSWTTDFALKENSCSDSSKRIHFIPVWFPDGVYSMVLVSGDVWTPAGMIVSRMSVFITISGDAYDGWFTKN